MVYHRESWRRDAQLTVVHRGVTAYTAETQVKAAVMALGPVVTEMARGVIWLTGAAIRVAATGVGCPEPIDGRPSLTGLAAVWDRIKARVEETNLLGCPKRCSNELPCECCVCFETSPLTLVVRLPFSFAGPNEKEHGGCWPTNLGRMSCPPD